MKASSSSSFTLPFGTACQISAHESPSSSSSLRGSAVTMPSCMSTEVGFHGLASLANLWALPAPLRNDSEAH
eukprot:1223946-Heterocapsa_arctica.AAC.1